MPERYSERLYRIASDLALFHNNRQLAAGFLHGVLGICGKIHDNLVNLGGDRHHHAAHRVYIYPDVQASRHVSISQREGLFQIGVRP